MQPDLPRSGLTVWETPSCPRAFSSPRRQLQSSWQDSDFQCKLVKTFLQNILACVSRSLKSFILFDPAIPFLGFYSKEIQIKMCRQLPLS